MAATTIGVRWRGRGCSFVWLLTAAVLLAAIGGCRGAGVPDDGPIEGDRNYPFLMSGHPRLCPQPTRVAIAGSTRGRGGTLHIGWIDRMMNMEFTVENTGSSYTTTDILEVEEMDGPPGTAPGPAQAQLPPWEGGTSAGGERERSR